MPSTTEKNKYKNNVKVPMAPTLATGDYASAKSKDPKLDSYIKDRATAKKSGDKSAQNAAQNKINSAYGEGPTDRKVEQPKKKKEISAENALNSNSKKMEVKKAVKLEPKNVPVSKPADPNRKVGKLTSSQTKTKLDKGTFKEDKTATESKRKEVVTDKIKAGDKKAGKKAGLKGGLKRKANKAGKKVGKAKSKRTALDKAGEATTRKEVKKSGVRGKFKRAAMDDVASKKKQTKEKMQEVILSAATFKDFNQMKTTDADEIADVQAPSTMNDGPIKYFKGKINYDIKEASNSNLSQSARNNYAKNAQHDMKSIGKMYKTPTEMNYAPTEMKGAKKKGGSILSKFMKSK